MLIKSILKKTTLSVCQWYTDNYGSFMIYGCGWMGGFYIGYNPTLLSIMEWFGIFMAWTIIYCTLCFGLYAFAYSTLQRLSNSNKSN